MAVSDFAAGLSLSSDLLYLRARLFAAVSHGKGDLAHLKASGEVPAFL